QAYVDYRGPALVPATQYFWTVRTANASRAWGPFAKPATFDTGLTDRDWHADWVRRPGVDPTRQPEDYSLFRREVTLNASPITRARVYASAGQQYVLYLNGRRVGGGPSFAYPDEQYYDVHDVTRALRPGRPNVIAFVTHWYGPGQGRPASAPGL